MSLNSLRQVLTRGGMGRVAVASCASVSSSAVAKEGDVVLDAFSKQQRQYKELMKGLSKIDVPLVGDAAAVKAYATEVEKLKKKVGMPEYEAIVKAEMAYAMSLAGNDVKKFVSSVLSELDVSKTAYEGISQDVMEAIAEAEKVSGKSLDASNDKGWKALSGKIGAIEKKYGLDGAKVKDEAVLEMYATHVAGMKETVQAEMQKIQETEGVQVSGVDLKGLKPQIA